MWDIYDVGFRIELFSIWIVGGELGIFLVRSGYKKFFRRFVLKFVDKSVVGGLDDIVIDVEFRIFSVVCYDDFGGLVSDIFCLIIKYNTSYLFFFRLVGV